MHTSASMWRNLGHAGYCLLQFVFKLLRSSRRFFKKLNYRDAKRPPSLKLRQIYSQSPPPSGRTATALNVDKSGEALYPRPRRARRYPPGSSNKFDLNRKPSLYFYHDRCCHVPPACSRGLGGVVASGVPECSSGIISTPFGG